MSWQRKVIIVLAVVIVPPLTCFGGLLVLVITNQKWLADQFYPGTAPGTATRRYQIRLVERIAALDDALFDLQSIEDLKSAPAASHFDPLPDRAFIDEWGRRLQFRILERKENQVVGVVWSDGEDMVERTADDLELTFRASKSEQGILVEHTVMYPGGNTGWRVAEPH